MINKNKKVVEVREWARKRGTERHIYNIRSKANLCRHFRRCLVHFLLCVIHFLFMTSACIYKTTVYRTKTLKLFIFHSRCSKMARNVRKTRPKFGFRAKKAVFRKRLSLLSIDVIYFQKNITNSRASCMTGVVR